MPQAKKNEENEDIVEEPEDKPAARKPSVKENDEDGTVTVNLGDDEEEKPAARKPRKERREESELERLRQENEGLRGRQAALEQHVGQRFQQFEQRGQQSQEDPYKARVKGIRSEQESIQTMIRSGALTDPAAVERARNRFYELNDEAEELAQERIIQRATERVARQQPQGQGEEAILKAEFPDVIANQGAVRWAMGEYHRLVSDPDSPAPQTLATSRKAMQAAAERFKLRQPTAPPVSASQQQRFGSIPAQAGARSGGAEVRLDAGQKRMATARWPDLEPEEAYAKAAAVIRSAERASQQTE